MSFPEKNYFDRGGTANSVNIWQASKVMNLVNRTNLTKWIEFVKVISNFGCKAGISD
jgi:hypothetical protein